MPKRALMKGIEGMDLRVVVVVLGARGRAWNTAGRERLESVSKMRKSRERMESE